MMVARRLNSFVFCILSILFSTRCSLLAFPLKASTRATAADEIAFTAEYVQKDDIEAVLTPTAAKFGKIGGRKMMEKGMFGKKYVIHKNHQKENTVGADQITKISGAKHNVEIFSHGHKGKEKMKRVSKMRAKISTTAQPVHVKNGDLFAFSADYSLAKSHSPRNN